MALKLLLIDDSSLVRKQLKDVFIHDGFEILEAETGKQAYDIIKATPPDIMVCDVNMPEMNGMELCKLLHDEQLSTNIFILMLTTEASPELKEAAKNYGVKAWITKPFNPKALQSVMQKIVALKKSS